MRPRGACCWRAWSARRSSFSISTSTARRQCSCFRRCSFRRPIRRTATLQSLATFALAFFARPVGSAVFGHFGDRIGRKATLVAALLTMGLSTIAIGLLPTYAAIGVAAPALLALCRFGQGFGLGGEWGGAVLLATENAPPGKRAWYGMFPQLGAPLGFILSTGIFVALTEKLERCAISRLGLARAVSREHRARDRGPVRPAQAHGDARVSTRVGQQRARARADTDGRAASIRARSCSAYSRARPRSSCSISSPCSRSRSARPSSAIRGKSFCCCR